MEDEIHRDAGNMNNRLCIMMNVYNARHHYAHEHVQLFSSPRSAVVDYVAVDLVE